jgi:hypothetical protein
MAAKKKRSSGPDVPLMQLPHNLRSPSHRLVKAVLSKPFLLVQMGNYGHGYEMTPLPAGLMPLALERERRGLPT